MTGRAVVPPPPPQLIVVPRRLIISSRLCDTIIVGEGQGTSFQVPMTTPANIAGERSMG